MFIGHWAPALAVAARSRAPGLVTLFVAAQLVDWAFFGLLLLGVEHMRFSPGISVMNPMDLYHMPYTHSLLGTLVFGGGIAAVVWALTKNRTAALLTGAVAVSHWFLDLLVHVPDLTLFGSPPMLGLGLWNYPLIEMPLEIGITFGALLLYVRAKRPATSRVAVLAAILIGLQFFNWLAPGEREVTLGTSLLAFVAFGLAALAAWWMGKSAANPA
jgi:hypothetical protein